MDHLRAIFRSIRQHIIRWWRLGFVIPLLLKQNPYAAFVGRRLFQRIPFLLPHDKSYYGFSHLVHPGDGLFLDVGANDGISVSSFRHIHSDYRILSLEPNLCHERALRKLKRDTKRFEYKLLGAGRSRSQMVLYVPILNGVPAYTAASLMKDFVERTMRDHYLPEQEDKSLVILEHRVDIVPIDDLDVKPDIIKIDTEGFDYEVLLGAVRTIEANRPVIMIEYNPDLMAQLEEFFATRRYQLLTYEHSQNQFSVFRGPGGKDGLDNRKAAFNIFCIPDERMTGLPIKHE